MSETPPEQRPADSSKARLGDFELKKRLGRGGMGEVFLARQVSLDRLVAVKTLSKELSKKEDAVTRFLREAKSMARLDHPAIVRVFAVDSCRGIHFAAIEYIDGQSLQDWLEQLGPLPIGDAVQIAMVCAEALKHAHDHSMIHRDIKPDNVLITKKGQVKVADFGLAKTMDDDVSMTQSGTGLGTPLYMAPEQARNAKHVDQRCDIYALGITLYHMLAGNLPYGGQSTLEVILAKEKGSYPGIRTIRSDVPERLELIVDKMMARDPAHRYKNCDDLIHDLAALELNHPALSFIEGAAAAGPSGSARAVPGNARRTMPGTSTQPAFRRPATTASSTAAGRSAADGKSVPDVARSSGSQPATSRMWFVQYENADEQLVVEKYSTSRILKMVAAGTITAKAKAKASAEGTWLPLAQFPEFTEAVEAQVARRASEIRREDMSSLYAKVSKAEANRHKWRGARNAVRGVVGGMSLILWIGGIVVAGALIFHFGPLYARRIAAGFGLVSDEAAADPPADPAASVLPGDPPPAGN